MSSGRDRRPSVDVDRFLSDHFPGLSLRPPLFYSWPIGLRFELAGDHEDREVRLQQSVERASSLLEVFAGKDDDLHLVLQSYRADDYFWTLVRDVDPSGFDVRIQSDPQNPAVIDSEGDEIVEVVLKARRFELDYRSMFAASTYLKSGPRLGWRVFIVNVRRGWVFQMYDDRGADVIAG